MDRRNLVWKFMMCPNHQATPTTTTTIYHHPPPTFTNIDFCVK